MNRLKIAQYIALAATACSVIGVILGGMSGSNFGYTLMWIGVIVGLVS